MEKQIALTPETFKALAGEKRVQILKELTKRRKTQSELAQSMGLSAPTIAEHLNLLEKAGLVHGIDEGHKWKYYALTDKGKEILNPGESRILVLLGTSAIAFIVAAAWLFSRFFNPVLSTVASAGTNSLPALRNSLPAAAPLADGAKEAVIQGATQPACDVATQNSLTMGLQGFNLTELTLLVILALLLGLMIGYWWNRRKSQL